MAAVASIDAIEWLRKQIEQSAPDPLRTMLVEMVNLLMSAEVDAVTVQRLNPIDQRWRRGVCQPTPPASPRDDLWLSHTLRCTMSAQSR